MLTEVLILLIAGVVLFELVEHVVAPLVALRMNRRRQPVTGAEGMVGKVVEVKRWSGAAGQVMVDGELWTAESDRELSPGDRATVREVRGLTLRVVALHAASGPTGRA